MSHSDTASELAADLGIASHRIGRVRAAIAVLWAIALLSSSLLAQATREEALLRIYPGAEIEAERIFLTETERLRAEELAGIEIPSLLMARYVLRRDGVTLGRAYIDTHVVRTKNESLLICLNPDGSVRRIEVTAFLEPPDYRAPEAWYAQFDSKILDDDLNLNRAVRPLAGATLTATATAAAVRRVLGIDAVLTRAGAR